jgi:tripartite-type tricarboxylate transporter receptor subunit TctC
LPAWPALAAFPDKPLRFVVPFPAGGGNDIVARALAEGMSKDLGQQVIVDNRAGAGTVIGTEYAATRPPDGYTILLASLSFSVNPSLLPSLPYDPVKSFTPILLLGRYPNVVVSPPDRPWKSMVELIAYARANPGKLNYGSFGNGTSPHLSGEMFKLLAGVDITHIPYKGAAPALTDMLGGRLDVIFSTASSAGTYVRGGRLRALAVTGSVRAAAYPDLPTIAEAGVKDYEAIAWYGILGPAGIPSDVVARLYASIALAAKAESFVKRSEEDGLEIGVEGPEALAKLISAQIEKWGVVVREAKMKPD